jgi:hypothetical protein
MSKKLLQYYRSKIDVGGKVLPKFQVDGLVPIDYSRRNVSESTNSGINNIVATQTAVQQQRAMQQRQAAIDAMREKQGYIKQGRNQSGLSKALSIAANPITTASYLVKGQRIPDNFDKASINPYDLATTILNPVSGVYGAAQIPGNLQRGEYGQASLNALGFIPALKTIPKYTRGIINVADRNFSKVGKSLANIEREGLASGLSDFEIAKRQLDEVGITSNQRQAYVPGVSDLVRKYVTPYGYSGGMGGNKLKETFDNIKRGGIDVDASQVSGSRGDAWRMYLGIPQKNKTFRIAETAPINHRAYSTNQLNKIDIYSLNRESEITDDLLRSTKNTTPAGVRDAVNNITSESFVDVDPTDVMGNYNARFTNEGLQYNDIWDLNPTIAPVNFLPRKVRQALDNNPLFYSKQELLGANGANVSMFSPRKMTLNVDRYLGKPFMSHGNLPLKASKYKNFLIDAIQDRITSYMNPGLGDMTPVIDRLSEQLQQVNKAKVIKQQGGEIDKYKYGGSLNRTVTCSNCGWSWKLVDGGKDPMTCHQCGGQIKMQQGGSLPEYQSRGQVKREPIDENTEFLKNWYSKRRINNPNIQKVFELDRSAYLKNLETPPPYTVVKSIKNTQNIYGEYSPYDNKLFVTKNAPNWTKTHELNHYVNLNKGAGKHMSTVHKEVIGRSTFAPSELSKYFSKKDVDYMLDPEETHSRIMTLRQNAGFKPDEVITPERLKGYLKTYMNGKNVNSDIEILLNSANGPDGLLDMLNNTAAVSKRTSIPIAQDGKTILPIYTENPRDPRIRAYNDSLSLYKQTQYNLKPYKSRGWSSSLLEKSLSKYGPYAKSSMKANPNHIGWYARSSEGHSPTGTGESSTWDKGFKNKVNTKIVPVGEYVLTTGDNAADFIPKYKKPVQPVIYRKPIVAKPQIVPTQQSIAPVQPIPPAYRMQGTTPVYGPSNSLIGMLNQDSGEFYPDYMNTAGRARVNQADTDMIGNQQNILEYLRMKGVNNPKVIPQKQVGGPILSTEGFKQGPPPQGSYYRIPSNTLYNPTPYRIKAVANTGQVQYLNPFDDSNINFPGADYVDEYPIMKSGGQHGGLDRWFAEKWVDIKTGKACGRQEGESRAYPACRPSKRVSSQTPKTRSEMSSSEKAKFKQVKTSSNRIPYNHKKK